MSWRLLSALVLAGPLALAPAPAAAFDWIGKIELDADGLRDEDAQVRLQAVGRLSSYDIAVTREHLLGALQDPDPRVRHGAARVLARHQVAEAAPAVIAWLADGDVRTRQVAADLLGDLGNEEAVDALVRSLGDQDSAVRLRAVQALGKIGGPAVMVPLIGRLDDDQAEVRAAAIAQLQELGDRRAVLALVAAFGDPSAEVRRAAIGAVGHLGDEAAIPALTRLLRDPAEDIKIAAVGSLGELRAAEETHTLIEHLGRGSHAFRARVAYSLGQIAAHDADGDRGRAAVGALVAALGDGTIRTAAVEALRVAGAAAVPALVAHLEGRLEGDPATAVLLLRDLGDPRATPALVAELDRGRVNQELLLTALARSGDPRALVPILSLLSSKDVAVRVQAMQALGPLLPTDLRAADVLVGVLDDQHLELQMMAADYLGRLRSPAAVPRLIALAGPDSPLRLRAAAVDALGEIGDRRAARQLLAIVRDGPAELQPGAASALIYLGAPATVAPLLAIAEDRRAAARPHAVRALGGVLRSRPDARTRKALEQLARREERALSLAAITALGAMGDPASAGTLVEIAVGGFGDRRRAAVIALGDLGAPAAAPALREALAASDDRISAAAAWSLGKLADAEAVDLLVRATRRRAWATPINASAALALYAPADRADALLRLLFHRDRFVRVNAAFGAGRLALAEARPTLLALLADDPSWMVRRAAARALGRIGGAEAELDRAAASDSSEPVRAAARAARAAPFAPPARTDWRSFYFVDPTRGDAPVRQEPYVLVTSDGLVTALYTDSQGEAVEERFPPGDYELFPRSRAQQY